jgi:hypothetical protein
MITRYPLVFAFLNSVRGDGFIAQLAVEGRALLLVDELPEKIWVEAVKPGGFAAFGDSLAEALKEFRQSFLAILLDIAADAGDFEAFRRGVEEFFNDTNEPANREWEAAVAR